MQKGTVMGGKAQIKRIRVTKPGHPARVLTFTTRGSNDAGIITYFVHRYNSYEFDEIVGKSEGCALGWLVANGWRYEWIFGN